MTRGDKCSDELTKRRFPRFAVLWWLDRYFGLTEKRTNLKQEILAGLTTFLTMAYIIFVQPAVLSQDFTGKPTGLDWGDYSESIPSFLIMVGIPLSYSIADGLALGFITYPIIKLLTGRGRQVSWLMYVMAILLLAYFIFFRAQLA